MYATRLREKGRAQGCKGQGGLQEGNGLGVIRAGWLMQWHRAAMRKEKSGHAKTFLSLPSRSHDACHLTRLHVRISGGGGLSFIIIFNN